jgi:peptide/nickel transport system permease protein
MVRFLMERFIQVIVVMFSVSSLTFMLLRLAPGDPAYILLTKDGVPASEQALTALREELGLTGTLWNQYVKWLADVFSGQWGFSYVSKEPVLEELLMKLPATLELAVAGFLVMVVITFSLGVSTAILSTGWWDRMVRLLALLGSALPSFWLGFLFIYIFSVKFGWLPPTGRNNWESLLLPAITLGLGMGTAYARVLRTHMLEISKQNFVKASKARGLSKSRILLFQVLKHATLPIVTMLGTSFAFMVGGSIIVESIFSWPGLGRYIIEAIMLRDYPVIQGYVILVSFLFVMIHFVVDIIYTLLDPRLGMHWEDKKF